MRKFRVALVALLAAASTAHAASISVDVAIPGWTEDSPGPGQTVILTITATANAGETDHGVFGSLQFFGFNEISVNSVSQTALESFDGAAVWTTGVLTSGYQFADVFNQIIGPTPFPVSNTPFVIATLTFTLAGVGSLYASWDEDTFDFFGAPTPPDVCIVGVGPGCPVIPEPATGALLGLGLGLLGLAARRRFGGILKRRRLMQRAALLLTALAAFSAAPSAHAASVQIVSDQATYLLGETVTLSIVATASSGEMATSVFGELLFSNPAMVLNPVATQTALVSFGSVPWTIGLNPCSSSACTAINQIGDLAPLPVSNTPLTIATITFTLGAGGQLFIDWNADTFDFFGVTDPPGTSFGLIPEPGSRALLGLGLLGVAARRRRRA